MTIPYHLCSSRIGQSYASSQGSAIQLSLYRASMDLISFPTHNSHILSMVGLRNVNHDAKQLANASAQQLTTEHCVASPPLYWFREQSIVISTATAIVTATTTTTVIVIAIATATATATATPRTI